MRHYSFKPAWIAVIGQLHRAEEKEALIALRQRQAKTPALALSELPAPPDELRYRNVTARGVYDAGHQFLLDNQVHAGQVGYFVLTPLRLAGSDHAVLVNRGWVPAPPERTVLPPVTVREASVDVRGTVDHFPSTGLRLSGAEVPAPGWPAVVQLIDAPTLSTLLGYPLLPYQVLLEVSQAEGYVRDWKPANVDPGKNRGYALQWFAFAATLAFLFVRSGLGKDTGTPRQSPP
jgi:surfeit locus 1 family protein